MLNNNKSRFEEKIRENKFFLRLDEISPFLDFAEARGLGILRIECEEVVEGKSHVVCFHTRSNPQQAPAVAAFIWGIAEKDLIDSLRKSFLYFREMIAEMPSLPNSDFTAKAYFSIWVE